MLSTYYSRLALRAMLVFGGLCLLSPAIILAAEPYAVRADIPADIKESYLVKAARDSVIPTQARVGIPAYPGAVVIRTGGYSHVCYRRTSS